MARTYFKILEAPQGRGEVFMDHQAVAAVNYVLSVEQEITLTDTPSGTGELFGAVHIVGQVKITRGRNFLDRRVNFSLHLADGRRFDFRASAGDSKTGVWQVANTDPRGFEEYR